MSRVRRFDEVDSDSDFELTPLAQKKKPVVDLDSSDSESSTLPVTKKGNAAPAPPAVAAAAAPPPAGNAELTEGSSSIDFDMDTASSGVKHPATQVKPPAASEKANIIANNNHNNHNKGEVPAQEELGRAQTATDKNDMVSPSSERATAAVVKPLALETLNTTQQKQQPQKGVEGSNRKNSSKNESPSSQKAASAVAAKKEKSTPPAAVASSPLPSSTAAQPTPLLAIPPRRQGVDTLPGGGLYPAHPSQREAADTQRHAVQGKGEDSETGSNDSFAEMVLPGGRRSSQGGRNSSQPPIYLTPRGSHGGPPSQYHDPSTGVLVKAQLRLEEHRMQQQQQQLQNYGSTPRSGGGGGVAAARLGSAARSTIRSPTRVSATPRESYGYANNNNASTTSGMANAGSAYYALRTSPSRGPEMSPSSAAQHARLVQENERLQSEVSYLSLENQKLRAATTSSDSSENIKLQLTIDMLRGELESKETLHQEELRKLHQENGTLHHKLKNTAEQSDSYASTAQQYKALYEEKQHDLEQLKGELQNLRYKHEEALERNRATVAQAKESAMAGEERARQLAEVLDDVKMQREHVQNLNTQLQAELRACKEERQHLKESVEEAKRGAARDRETHAKEIARMEQDVALLKEEMKNRERALEARLLDEKKTQASIEQRLSDVQQDREAEARSYKKIIDDMKNDQKRSSAEEAEKRGKLEEKIRRLEQDLRDAIGKRDDALRAEQEKRIRHYRQEYQNEKRERESAQREAERLAEENARLEESVQYYQGETEMLSANLTTSEEERAKATQQCQLLSQTLEDLMMHDDEQAATIDELRNALSDALAEIESASSARKKRSAPSPREVGETAAAVNELSAENDRLTNECTRLTQQRDALIEENGNIAQELLKWKNEMKKYIASQQ